MRNRLHSLFDRDFFRGVLAIGMPVAVQNLLTSSLSLIDSLMIGSQGELALAAVGVAGQFGTLLFSAYWGLCCGGTMFFAQYWGAQDMKGIRRAYGITLSTMLLVSLIFTGLATLAPAWVMGVYTNVPAVQQLGVRYLRIVGFAYIGQTLSVAVSALLRATENVKLPLFASLAAIATNTFLNWVLIYGNLGMPAMGVEGAAIASVAAACVNLLVLILASVRQRNVVVTRLRDILDVHWGFIKEFFAKATPIIANELFYGLAIMAVNAIMGRQGESNIAAMTIFRTLEGLIFAFFGGLANASSVMVGKRVGAGDLRGAMADAKRFLVWCPLMTLLVCLAVLALRPAILNLFDISAAVRGTVMWMLVIYTFASPLRTCNYIQVNTYRAGGESRMGMYFEIGGMWLITVPLVFLAGQVWHLPFLLVFGVMYTEELVKLPLEMRYLFSARWIKPVTPEGRAALAAFRESALDSPSASQS